MRLKLFLIIFSLLFVNQVFAQNYGYVESALLFGNTRPGGSARIQALGGTQISLGGDYSSAFSNPAGLGMFNRSEFSITPGLSSNSVKTQFGGNTAEETSSRFQIPGFGAVFHVKPGNPDGQYVSGAFAITFNRVNDFNGSFGFQGENDESSIIQSWIDGAFGETTLQFDPGDPDAGIPAGRHYNSPVGLAYYNFLIGPASTLDDAFPDDEYFTDVQSNFEERTSTARQREEGDTEGASNQWSLAYGANFSDKFFIGGGIGIGTIRYESRQSFNEAYDDDPIFNSLSLQETMEARGTGINATLGAIVRPLPFLQLGLSYKTPTYYSIAETYEASLSSSWNNFDYYGNGEEILTNESASTDIVNSDYSLTVPGKLSFGATLISKRGFVSADLEYMNPANLRYKSEIDGISFSPENQQIKGTFKSVLNYRVGAEVRLDIFRVRGGFGTIGNPFKEDVEQKNMTFSGGVGVRLQNFYVDFALIHQQHESQYSPYVFYQYQDIPTPVVDITKRITTGMITLGLTY